MGYGSLMTCRKCQNTYQLFTGCGMGYHLEYEKTMKQIKSGKFGKRMQEIANDDEFVADYVEQKLYVWLAKVSWLGKLVSVFWWVELDFFSLECNEVFSNEL